MEQATLSESLSTSTDNIDISQERVSTILKKLDSLQIPAPSDSGFDHNKWKSLILNTSGFEALKAREEYKKDQLEYKILSAIAARNEKQYIQDAFEFSSNGDPDPDLVEKTKEFTYQALKRFPLTVLLSCWIQELKICDKNAYESETGKESAGYYHPTEHWIAIRKDTTMEPEFWSVTRKRPQEVYYNSPILHELGHAFHYMMGLQTKGCEDVDNRTNTDPQINLKTECLQSKQQYNFVYNCIKAYGLLLDDVYETLSYNEYQKLTIEEMVAVGFNVYITSPRYLEQIQPLLYTILNKYCE